MRPDKEVIPYEYKGPGLFGFEIALQLMKFGYCCNRQSWPSQDHFICRYRDVRANPHLVAVEFDKDDGESGSIWMPTETDLHADDWQLVRSADGAPMLKEQNPRHGQKPAKVIELKGNQQ